ncbi:MAG TPA: class I SAM-dependent methyltransferase [Gaiellaceae bacterium]|nr:class I SAM-dependent methyltransferase [Gaiellaceae bacterium]
MISIAPKLARWTTNVVTRVPFMWRFLRGPLTARFDELSADWETTRLSPEHLVSFNAALDRIELTPRRILDLGTGTGAAARAMAKRWPDAEILGVDASKGMLAEARAHASSDHERYELGDASKLAVADAAFDLVTMVNMIPFYDELARVTAQGGRLVAAFSRGADTPIYVPFDRFRRELERRGFTQIAEISAGPGVSLLAVRGDRS